MDCAILDLETTDLPWVAPPPKAVDRLSAVGGGFILCAVVKPHPSSTTGKRRECFHTHCQLA